MNKDNKLFEKLRIAFNFGLKVSARHPENNECDSNYFDRAIAVINRLYPTIKATKKLSQVTKEDAIEIIKAGYPLFFTSGQWKLTDEEKDIHEPCKKLSSRHKVYLFWFFDDNIDIDFTDDEKADMISFDSCNFDADCRCYVKAHNLGYEIEKFKDLNLK